VSRVHNDYVALWGLTPIGDCEDVRTADREFDNDNDNEIAYFSVR